MAIQIIGLRKRGEHMVQKFFQEKWRASSVADLIQNIENYVSIIPEKERYNLYYTLASCVEGDRPRVFLESDTIAYDIDGMDINRIEEYIDPVCDTLRVPKDKIGIVCSGNGLHFLIQTDQKIYDPDFFRTNKKAYVKVCSMINRALKDKGLKGEADTQIFDAARILRLPNTENRKPDKGIKKSYVIQKTMVPISYSLAHSLGMEVILGERDTISEKAMQLYGRPDNEAVLSGCDFLKFCDENAETLTYDYWWREVNLLSRLENGEEIVHERSSRHKDYNADVVQDKIENLLLTTKALSCKGIDEALDICKNCKYYKDPLVVTPLAIKGRDHIATMETGFRRIVNGKPSTIDFEDLVRFYRRDNPYITVIPSKLTYNFNGTHWTLIDPQEIKNFAHINVKPMPNEGNRVEFLKLIQCTNLKPQSWFTDSTDKKINLKNGVLDLETMELLPHSEEFGFLYCLPYNYDPEAKCPKWEKFIDEVMVGDKDKARVLQQYVGYCFSGGKCLAQKAMILLGSGENGKSTFINMLQKLAGEDNYSSLTMESINNEQHRVELVGKLFNVAEETPNKAMVDSSTFKNLVTGGEFMCKVVFSPPFKHRNTAKLMFAANEMPKTIDTTRGMFRRLIIVTFNQMFNDIKGNKDPFIEDKLERELTGIFNWVLQGYSSLVVNKYRFHESVSVKKALDDYESETDQMKMWIEDYTTKAEGELTTLDDCYRSYKTMCHSSGINFVFSKIAFAKKVYERLGVKPVRTTEKGIRKKSIPDIKLNESDFI
jgi:putative DNA primase/helicase